MDQGHAQINYLQQMLAAKKMSRREFIGRVVACGATTALAMTLASQTARAAGPKKGGWPKVGMAHGSTSDTFDPAVIVHGLQVVVLYTICNMLTEVQQDGSVGPELAENWDASPDASVWTFELRKGVEFHDGRSFTAKDVIASINYHRGEDSTSGGKSLVEPIESIRADGDHTVVFQLSGGNADFPFALSTYNFPIYPAAEDGGLDWKSGVGTGGYVLKEFEPGVSVRLERNANYWKEGRAHFDGCDLLSILDVAARTNAIRTDEVDIIDRPDLKTLDRLANVEGIVAEETSGAMHYSFPMRTDTPPFDDNNVRLAIKHAVDRDALVRTILLGHGTVGNDNPIGPSYQYFAKELEQRVYDLDKAKFYLKKAGLNEITVNLSAADAAFTGALDAAALYKEHAAGAGININIIREPNDGYWSDVWMEKPWSACYWTGAPTADAMFTMGYEAGGNWNDTYWNHERFNMLLKESRGELDNAKRREMYAEMQLIVRDEGGVVLPMFANDVFARSTRVEHADLASDQPLDGRRFIERWWWA
jgi:peptide/nickel transport system substrate-binding protein